jgi:hypothetical protein
LVFRGFAQTTHPSFIPTQNRDGRQKINKKPGRRTKNDGSEARPGGKEEEE